MLNSFLSFSPKVLEKLTLFFKMAKVWKMVQHCRDAWKYNDIILCHKMTISAEHLHGGKMCFKIIKLVLGVLMHKLFFYSLSTYEVCQKKSIVITITKRNSLPLVEIHVLYGLELKTSISKFCYVCLSVCVSGCLVCEHNNFWMNVFYI